MPFDTTPRMGGQLPDVRTMTASTARILDDAIDDVDWSLPPERVQRLTVPVPSGALAGYAAGPVDAPRILLVPGATGSKEDFALMAPLLVQAGYRVESYDLAGQYQSADAGPERLDPPRRRYDDALFLDDLLTIIRHGSAPVHLLGYSYGGIVVQLAALRHPELVASLSLLSCPPLSGQSFRGLKQPLGMLSRVSGARIGAGLMLWGIRNNLNRVPPHRYAFVLERLPHTRRQSVDDIVRLMRRAPVLGPAVAALPIPKLVAFGSHDLWPSRTHRRYAAMIGAEVAEYESGHSPCEDSPHQLTRDLVRVIEAPARAGDG